MNNKFSASDEMTILGNDCLNEYNAKFITTIINSNKSKYAFGRKAFNERLKKQKLILPIDKNEKPDFKYMSNFVKNIKKEKIEKTLEYIYIYIYNFNDCRGLQK